MARKKYATVEDLERLKRWVDEADWIMLVGGMALALVLIVGGVGIYHELTDDAGDIRSALAAQYDLGSPELNWTCVGWRFFATTGDHITVDGKPVRFGEIFFGQQGIEDVAETLEGFVVRHCVEGWCVDWEIAGVEAECTLHCRHTPDGDPFMCATPEEIERFGGLIA